MQRPPSADVVCSCFRSYSIPSESPTDHSAVPMHEPPPIVPQCGDRCQAFAITHFWPPETANFPKTSQPSHESRGSGPAAGCEVPLPHAHRLSPENTPPPFCGPFANPLATELEEASQPPPDLCQTKQAQPHTWIAASAHSNLSGLRSGLSSSPIPVELRSLYGLYSRSQRVYRQQSDGTEIASVLYGHAHPIPLYRTAVAQVIWPLRTADTHTEGLQEQPLV